VGVKHPAESKFTMMALSSFLDVLTKPHNGHKEFLPQGTFYRKAVFGGYSGKEERLNNLASNMNEVENANIGMFHLTHYRLRRDN